MSERQWPQQPAPTEPITLRPGTPEYEAFLAQQVAQRTPIARPGHPAVAPAVRRSPPTASTGDGRAREWGRIPGLVLIGSALVCLVSLLLPWSSPSAGGSTFAGSRMGNGLAVAREGFDMANPWAKFLAVSVVAAGLASVGAILAGIRALLGRPTRRLAVWSGSVAFAFAALTLALAVTMYTGPITAAIGAMGIGLILFGLSSVPMAAAALALPHSGR